MLTEHYLPLAITYVIGLAAWLAASHLPAQPWPPRPAEHFLHPVREFGFAILAGLAVVAIGQLWNAGIRLPEEGAFGPTLGAINQVFIFAPILLLVRIRRQSWDTAWLPRGHLGLRLLVGLVVATLAVTVYSLLRAGTNPPWVMVGRIWRYENLDTMTQVFLEDVTIAILFVRLAAAISSRWATVVVACLFAAGHIPTMLSQGATWMELAGLLRDAGLGVAAILVLQRSRDVVWFWCLHFCLDMTQFTKISGHS